MPHELTFGPPRLFRERGRRRLHAARCNIDHIQLIAAEGRQPAAVRSKCLAPRGGSRARQGSPAARARPAGDTPAAARSTAPGRSACRTSAASGRQSRRQEASPRRSQPGFAAQRRSGLNRILTGAKSRALVGSSGRRMVSWPSRRRRRTPSCTVAIANSEWSLAAHNPNPPAGLAG